MFVAAVCIGVVAGSGTYALLRFIQNKRSGFVAAPVTESKQNYLPPPLTDGWQESVLASINANPDEGARAALLDLTAIDYGDANTSQRFLRAFDLLHKHSPAVDQNAEMNFVTGYLLGKLSATWNLKGPFPLEAQEIGYHAIRFSSSKNDLERSTTALLLWVMLADPEPARPAAFHKELQKAFATMLASDEIKFTLEQSIERFVQFRKDQQRPELAVTSPDALLRTH